MKPSRSDSDYDDFKQFEFQFGTRTMLVILALVVCGIYLFYDSGKDERAATITQPKLLLAQSLTKRRDSSVERTAAQCLEIQLSLPPQPASETQVVWTMTNHCLKPVYLLPWHLPIEGKLGYQYFQIKPIQDKKQSGSLLGEALRYVGPVAKRAAPTNADLIEIHPAHDFKASVELTDAFKFNPDQMYQVSWFFDSMVVSFEKEISKGEI